MRFRGDERAVTVQIGAVLLFGFIIVSMSLYQATVVPDHNEEVEFDHNKQVHQEFVDLRGNVVESASDTTARPATVSLGTRYPSRTLFVNPGPASGRLYSRPLGNLSVTNVSTDGEAGDYLSGDVTYATESLVYRPNYNVFQSAPTTVYENTVAYNRFGNGYNGTLAGQSLVNGRTISLVLLGGTYSESGAGAVTVDARAASAATRTVPVRSNGSDTNVTLTVPTALSAENWTTMLEDSGDYDPDEVGNLSDGAFVAEVDPVPGEDAVRIVMERGPTYDLRVGKVGVGADVEEPSPRYLTRTGPLESRVPDDGTQQVTFEVRDRYNNPVSGATVNVSVHEGSGHLVTDDGDTRSLSNVTANEDGRVTVEYDPGSVTDEETVEIRASFETTPSDTSFDAENEADVATTFTAFETASGSGDGGVNPPGATPYGIEWDETFAESQEGITECDGGTCTYDLSEDSNTKLDLEAFTDPTEAYVNVDFYANDSSIVTRLNPSEDNDEDGDGRFETDVSIGATGHVQILASSTATGDVLNLTVVDGGGTSPTADAGGPYSVGEGSSIQLDGTGSSDPDGSISSYDWTITDDPTGGASLTNPDTARPTFDAPADVSGETDVTVELTVTDDSGETDTTSTPVTVSDSPPSPTVSMRVDDLTDRRSNDPVFVVSYSVSNTNGSFQRVDVETASTSSGASATADHATERGHARLQPGYGAGQRFEVTVEVVYDDGDGEYVAASETLTDRADVANPSANDDLSVGSSAAATSFDVSDRSNTNTNDVDYRVDYAVSSGDFTDVELFALNRNANGASVTTTSASRSANNVKLEPGDGAGTSYRVGILVYDDTGAVVDVQSVRDTADGDDP